MPTEIVAVLLLGTASFCQVQTKRIGRDAIERIVDGESREAAAELEKHLADDPGDLESLFCLAVAHAQLREPDKAIACAERAIAGGLPVDRFVAGPRGLLEPLVADARFQALLKERGAALIHGPLLGCVTDASARFWVRTSRPAQVRVTVSRGAEPVASATERTAADRDFTAICAVTGLSPATEYDYEIALDGTKVPGRRRFRTHPPPGARGVVRIGFGGGAGYTPRHERMWRTVAAQDLAAFLFLGDNVYIDAPAKPDVQRYCYYRRQARPEFRAFTASTPIYAIWDDHDFTTNDGRGGPAIDEPVWKRAVWRLYRENWNNPAYGGGEEHPGCWFDVDIGDVRIIMLDGRYYRTAPGKPGASMLGPVQKRWLFERLASSKAAFTVLASPVPWASGTKPGSLDTWDGYPEERAEIFAFLGERALGGVILLSADRHRSDAWKIERPGTYPLYEFESSRLTNVHTHAVMPRALFSYNTTCSFGVVSFDTERPDPEATYRIVTIDNETVYSLTLRRSELGGKP